MSRREDLNPEVCKFEYGLAGAVYHWVNYVQACGNTKLIEERSIRYPLAEFIERKYKGYVTLEENEKGPFKGKRYDFVYSLPDTEAERGTSGFIEVKLLKDDTKKLSEQIRFFFDLVRLAISGGETNYFILFGERKSLGPCFKYVGSHEQYEELAKRRFSGDIMPPFGIYSEWFSFNIYQEVYFCVDKYDWHKKEFSKTHHDKTDKPIVIDGLTIKTKLMAVIPISEEQSHHVVYIWKV